MSREAMEMASSAPEWDIASEAMLHINDLEALLGGANGPSIRLRALVLKMSAEAKQAARSPLTEDQINEAQEAAYRKLCSHGYNGSMGGSQWDLASARAIETAHGIGADK